MNGSGCKNCPVSVCDTSNYRGSRCSILRDKHGLGDPITNADVIRLMTDEQLLTLVTKIEDHDIDYSLTFCDMCNGEMYDCEHCKEMWLQSSAKAYNGLWAERGINEISI